MPFCSIVTINFNQADSLKHTLESVASQDFLDYESIVVDGGSTDHSLEVAGRFDNLISKLISEKDSGIYDAMNKGAGFAQGEWLLFLNAGDTFINRNTLSECAALLKNSNADLVYGSSMVSYSSMERQEKAGDPSEWKKMPYIHQSLWYRTPFAKKFPFNTAYRICSDYEQYIRMRGAGLKFGQSDLTISRVSAGGLSDKKRNLASLEKKRIFLHHHPSSRLKSLYFILESLQGRASIFLHKILPSGLSRFLRKLKYSV